MKYILIFLAILWAFNMVMFSGREEISPTREEWRKARYEADKAWIASQIRSCARDIPLDIKIEEADTVTIVDCRFEELEQ